MKVYNHASKRLFVNVCYEREFKDVLMGIPNSDQLGVTMAVIHVAGQRLSTNRIIEGNVQEGLF